MSLRLPLAVLGFGTVGFYAACGGLAIIDPPLEGSGGASGSTVSSTVAATSSSDTSSATDTSATTGSTTNQTVSSPAAVTTTTGGGPTCDVGDCGTCLNSNCAYNACQSSYDACFNSQDCNDFIDCISNCQDEDCFEACGAKFPSGGELYFQLIDCAICTPNVCFKDCDGAFGCGP